MENPLLQKMQRIFTTVFPLKAGGFPHSDTVGSKLRSSYPATIVAMYVLLRR